MARVASIVATIHLDDGSAHTVISEGPQPQGDNPAYLNQQIETGMNFARDRLMKVAEAYGPQIKREA